MEDKKIYVYLNLSGKDVPVGELWSHFQRGKEISTFEYYDNWLQKPYAFSLEPNLFLDKGLQAPRQGLKVFGAFGDSAPDTWGRILIKRYETKLAKKENREPKTLNEIDYLLRVNDFSRQGAIRFKDSPDGSFLTTKPDQSVPPLIDIKKLLIAAEKIENNIEDFDEIKMLLLTGSSLGGARPKASVLDKDGNLCIAKFPKNSDEYNVVLSEALALTLAKNAGLRTQEWFLMNIQEKDVIVVKRFDRIGTIRIPFLSAMSMLNAYDNDEIEYSYMEIADIIRQQGAFPTKDLTELWKRIAFSVMISNTDDHLRNHGFLYVGENGWQLSPLYDINPNPVNSGTLSTNISVTDNSADLELVMSVSEYFGIKHTDAKIIIDSMKQEINKWVTVAKNLNIKKSEIDILSNAFKI